MDIFFNNIYKSRKTCLEMLEDRNYDITDTVTFTRSSFQSILGDDNLKIKSTVHLTPIDILTKKSILRNNFISNVTLDYESELENITEFLEEISDEDEDEGEEYGEMERSYDERGNEEHDYNELSNLKDTHAEESAGIIEKTDIEQNAGSLESNFSSSSTEKTSKTSLNLSEISESPSKSTISFKSQNGGDDVNEIIEDICVVKFIFDTKLIKKSLEALSKLSDSITSIILILCVDDNKVFIKDPDTGRSMLSSRYLQLDYDNEHIEVYHYKQMIVNITHHNYVPKHELVDVMDHDSILRKYSLKNKKGLPCILKNDPICRYYGGSVGDIFKIHRKDRFGESIVYRCVNDDEIDFDSYKLKEKNLLRG